MWALMWGRRILWVGGEYFLAFTVHVENVGLMLI